MWALRVILISYVVLFIVNILPHFIGYVGYNLVLIRHACSVLPPFISALQAILF